MKINHKIVDILKARAFMDPPFNDGYKIAVVLPGGIMSGITVAGAMIALEELGLSNAIDVGDVASCGFPNLSYLLSKQSEYGSTIYAEELSGGSFINFLRLIVLKSPVDYDWAVKSVHDLKPLNHLKIWESHTNILLRLKNNYGKVVYLEPKDFDPSEYFSFFKASISQPIISKGAVIEGKRYFDGQFGQADLNDHIRRALERDYTHIVIIYNRSDQRKLILPPSDRILEIVPDVSVRAFETRPLQLFHSRDEMRKKVLNLFSH